MKSRNRRALNRNRKNNGKKVCLIGINCSGLSSKMQSFRNLILNARPCIFFLQETKFKIEGKLRDFKEYQTYELIRKNKECGGLAIGALEEVEPVFISEGDDNTEVVVIEVNMGIKIRCVNGYGPQENDQISKKKNFGKELVRKLKKLQKMEKDLYFKWTEIFMVVLNLFLATQIPKTIMENFLNNF